MSRSGLSPVAPPFAYFGGKAKNAERIAALLPAHTHYVEPFAGSLAVLLAKPRSRMETVNDLDGDLMVFWRVLRDQPDELARLMALTPHSRAEHAAANLADDVTDLERARRVWVLLSQGRGGTLRRTGWRFYQKAVGSHAFPDYLAAYVERAYLAAARLQGVTLECRDALDVVAAYGRHPDAVLYCDPPYLGSVRSLNYRHEMASEGDHRKLAEALHECRSAVVLSGYRSPLYDRLYAAWSSVEFGAWSGNGNVGDRVEVLWSNRPLNQPTLEDAHP